MKNIIFILIFSMSLMSLSLCAEDVVDDPLSDLISPAEYKVFSTVLRFFSSSYAGENVVILKEKTRLSGNENMVTLKTKADIKKNLGDDITDDLLDKFANVNAKSVEFENYFDKDLHVEFISKEKEKRIFHLLGQGWKIFYDEYPNAKGIYSFSRAALNESKTEALVYFDSATDFGKKGLGYYIFLKKTEEKWKIEKKYLSWQMDGSI